MPHIPTGKSVGWWRWWPRQGFSSGDLTDTADANVAAYVLPSVMMSEIRCSICAHLPLGRLLPLSYQLLISFKKSLKGSALPYQGRVRLTLMKSLGMPNPLPPAEICLNPELNSDMSWYTACILPESFLGTCRYILCVFRCP